MFRLALACGFPHPRFMLAQYPLSSQDITECVAYSREEPYGAVRGDYIGGTLAALLFNTHRPKGEEPRHWYDYFPNSDMPTEARAKLDARVKAALLAVTHPAKAAENAIAMFKAFNQRFVKKGKQ